MIPIPQPGREGRFALALLACGLLAACATPPPPVPSTPPVEETTVPAAPGAPAPVLADKTPAPECRVAAVGDIMLGGTATPELTQYGYDYPFDRTRELLQQAPIVFGNLEGPLTDAGQPATAKQYVFRSPPDKVAPALTRAGFNVVSLANNHTLDYGPEGLEQTRRALAAVGVLSAGAGRNEAEARQPALLPCPAGTGPTVAILAYSLTFPEEFWAKADSPGTAFGHERHVRADVAAARARADIVVVSFHWGQEGKSELRDYQIQLARAAIDAGAAAILGHHPHVLQGVERYRDGVILYSLGNFAFGSYSNTATRSAIAMLTFRDRRWRELRLLPLNVKNAEVVFQPRPLAGPQAEEVVRHLQHLSHARGTTLENRDGVAWLANNDP